MPLVRSWYGPAVVLAGLSAACAPKEPPAPPAPPAVDSTQVRSGVDAMWKQWVAADTAGNVAGMAALVSDSIRIDAKGQPAILGKAAWQSFASAMIKGMSIESETITPDVTVAVSNDLAYQSGNYVEETVNAKKKKTTDYGRYAAAIEKSPDGVWRVRYIMSFSDSTVAAK